MCGEKHGYHEERSAMQNDRPRTRLEEELDRDTRLVCERLAHLDPLIIQRHLDEIGPAICDKVGPQALDDHNKVIYEETAHKYAGNPEHYCVPDQLLVFMEAIPDRSLVLDLGCGSGRDAVFMSLRDPETRAPHMQRMKYGIPAVERFGIPRKVFCVIGVDASQEMVKIASLHATLESVTPFDSPTTRGRAFASFMTGDIHKLEYHQHWRSLFDGVWSSAALFMHTPREFIAEALRGVFVVLKPGGVFGVSYANNAGDMPYHNLRYSRTGEIKYFSRPTPKEIKVAASHLGATILHEEYSDLTFDGTVKKDFFITQFFRKE
jgi:SAM-dependent methyltransferase